MPVLARHGAAGIMVDAGRSCSQLSAPSSPSGWRELEAEIHKLAGRRFNIGSPKQLGEVLFDELGLGGGKKGKTGAYATGADVLETLAAAGPSRCRQQVLDWRQLAKLKSTYADALVGADQPGRPAGCTPPSSWRSPATGRLVVDRSEPAEHPDPHRGGPQDPPRLRRRAGA